MSEPFFGEIRMFPYSYAPNGWLPCNGQTLSIAQNPALFSLLGVTYGGDGRTNFALPNLQGMVAIGAGTGPGLTPRPLGSVVGEQNHTLTLSEMPAHTHTMTASPDEATSGSPIGNTVGSSFDVPFYKSYSPSTAMTALSPLAATPAGGSQPHDNMQPYLVMGYYIATQGIYPSRP